MFRPVALGFLLCTAPFAVAQTTPSTQQQQQQPQNAVQPGQPGPQTRSVVPEDQNAATAAPAFAPGSGGAAADNDNLRDAPKVVRVSGGVMAGMIVHRVEPVYPQASQPGEHIVLAARIGKDGRVKNVSVVSCPQELQRASVDAVKQWVFKPFLLNGEPVLVDTTVVLGSQGNNLH
jgi:hypothetical protein